MSVTYPQFIELPDGTLQFWYREGISGKSRELMDALPAGATTWRPMGTILDVGSTHEGTYLNHIAVDSKTGMIDLMFEWRRTPDPSTTNDVGYAQSPDGGRTWETATGKPIALPIAHDAEDTILKTAASGSGLENNGGLTVDALGHPHGVVVFGAAGGPDVVQLWFDGHRWHRDSLGDVLDGRPAMAGTPDGQVWMLGIVYDTLEAVDVTPGDTLSRVTLARVPPGWEAVFDSRELALQGRVQLLIPSGDRPAVVEADLSGAGHPLDGSG
jgi:hypothetical protein